MYFGSGASVLIAPADAWLANDHWPLAQLGGGARDFLEDHRIEAQVEDCVSAGLAGVMRQDHVGADFLPADST